MTSGLPRALRPAVREWFRETFAAPTRVQTLGLEPILAGRSALLFAPTGSGKTLAAFLGAIDRLMFEPAPDRRERCRVVYVSPLRALAVDVERNLRAPLAGIARVAERRGEAFHVPTLFVRTGDTPASERARALRAPPDILITTPESLFLSLTSNARATLASVEAVIVDEIHVMVGTKRGAHLALSLERLEELAPGRVQRIGLSATVGSGWQMENADIGFSRLIGLGPLRHIMFTGRFGAFQDEGGLFFGARGFIAGLAVGLATKPWQVLTIGAENNPIGVGLDLTFEGAGYFAKDTPEGFPPGNGFGSVAILPGVRSIKTGDFAFSLMVGPKVLLGGPEPWSERT